MKVFISFSSQDKKFVLNLSEALKSHGVDVWCYLWEMKAGDSLINKINDGLNSSDHLIAILSKNSLDSHWVKKELNAGFMLEVKGNFKIIPALIDNCKEQLPPLLQERIYADFRRDFAVGFKEIRQALGVLGMVDKTVYQDETGKERKFSEDQFIEINKMRALRRDDKLYIDFPEDGGYSEITDEIIFHKNKYFEVEWDNLIQKPRKFELKNISQYKVILPDGNDILEKTVTRVGSINIEKYKCKFGAEFELQKDTDGKLIGFSQNENCRLQANVKYQTLSFGSNS
ncbi:hypothetical protein A2316_00475 [Candidatus Falkowbacteria bacterium RIFOXYB2_FULL_38_15]|uniref:TIR domain-containing protein n=1 Tax=Candidatus Falkowbacteria bacterium RIFOXYA2_FULL_38_12 TaxID=1797993 RepID=A0A1F5S2C1_9BACT|nr:MAG: hypothetical protein A2257_04430 [Candidatus Falkowbacteria bacterium RIFOXYA2_FULL_38_12]OGF32872.1 MAG: hypothetical protein A2316_00475 [Candidatus Falkowbacteria bacterium RIFOXYB2_FULL_38_15]OGF44008.1 MAG: hypothetical protein A2555_01205 [Candidatus Falkowbacteria bacterium RIFOXYD2_FULL_39_16]